MQNLLNSFKVSMLLVDNRGHILFANETLLREHTLTLQALQGKKYSEVFDMVEVEFNKIFEHLIRKKITYMIRTHKHHLEIVEVTEVKWEAEKYYILQFIPLDEAEDRNSIRTTEEDYKKNIFANLNDAEITQQMVQMTQIADFIVERSEAKVLEERIAQLRAENQLTERELKYFVDLSVDFAHEFKSPLNIIMSGMQLIQAEIEGVALYHTQSPQIIRYIEMMKYNTYRLVQLVDDMMDKYAIEGGNMQLRMKEVDIIQVIEAACMAHVEYIRTKGLELIFDTEVEELPFVCDKEKIERIVTNILSNAWKYSKQKGFIGVSIKLTEEGILLCIEDNGIGIPEDMVENIFNRYVTIEGNEPKYAKSSGIGLSIVKTLVELHKGRIWVESKKDKGTKVCITLPHQQ